MIRFGLSILIIAVGSVTMPTDMSFVVWYYSMSTFNTVFVWYFGEGVCSISQGCWHNMYALFSCIILQCAVN